MPTEFRLAELLEERGMTQAELARLTGLGIRTVSRLARNETGQVSLGTLDKIATALGVTPGELIVQKGKRKAK